MNELWNRFEGQALGGSYVLGARVSAGEHSAVYLTESAEHASAVAKITLAEDERGDLHLMRWAVASQLSHLNLIRILKTGRSELEGVPLAFVVMERADETLAGVLAERALSEQETREMLLPALSALSYLHENGFSHAALRPSNVMAAGDTLKLSSDNVVRIGEPALNPVASRYDAPEISAGVPAPAGDIWSLGASLVHALTLQYAELREDRTVAFPLLPEPFATVVRHCLVFDASQRWTAPEILQAMNAPTPSAAAPEKLSTSKVAPPVRPETKFEPPSMDPPRRVLASRPSEPAMGPVAARERPQWLVPGIAIAALVLLLVIVAAMMSAGRTESPAVKTAPSSLPQPLPQPRIPPASVPAASDPAPPAHVKTRAPAPPIKRGASPGSWYVVVATYTGKDAAEKRASAITHKWPRFRAHVFEPPVRDPHHLVVIGAGLSQDEAESLRKRARAAGLPSDVYIKKFGG